MILLSRLHRAMTGSVDYQCHDGPLHILKRQPLLLNNLQEEVSDSVNSCKGLWFPGNYICRPCSGPWLASFGDGTIPGGSPTHCCPPHRWLVICCHPVSTHTSATRPRWDFLSNRGSLLVQHWMWGSLPRLLRTQTSNPTFEINPPHSIQGACMKGQVRYPLSPQNKLWSVSRRPKRKDWAHTLPTKNDSILTCLPSNLVLWLHWSESKLGSKALCGSRCWLVSLGYCPFILVIPLEQNVGCSLIGAVCLRML